MEMKNDEDRKKCFNELKTTRRNLNRLDAIVFASDRHH